MPANKEEWVPEHQDALEDLRTKVHEYGKFLEEVTAERLGKSLTGPLQASRCDPDVNQVQANDALEVLPTGI